MRFDAALDDIRKELAFAVLPPGEALPPGLSEGAIEEAELRLGRRLPDAFRAWLGLSNGPCIGPGGFFGIRPSRPGLDIERLLKRHEEWAARSWIPVAGDGCGNYYVTLNDSSDPPVGFVEVMGAETVSFVVASRVTLFIRLQLEKERGALAHWPFDSNLTSRLDPQLTPLGQQWRLPWAAT
jgi:hypothetical protein